MNRIAQLRKSAGLSQFELARRLKIAQNTLSQYENEVRKPPGYVITNLATLFGVTPNYVLGIADAPADNAKCPFEIANVTRVIRLYDEQTVNLYLSAGFKLLCVCTETASDGSTGVVYSLGWDRDPQDIPLSLQEYDGIEYDEANTGWFDPE